LPDYLAFKLQNVFAFFDSEPSALDASIFSAQFLWLRVSRLSPRPVRARFLALRGVALALRAPAHVDHGAAILQERVAGRVPRVPGARTRASRVDPLGPRHYGV
jgi:hypothetical protein